jgi:hypothetical protein
MSTMSTYFSNLLFITVNAPESTNIISVNEAVWILFFSRKCITQSYTSKQSFLQNIHAYKITIKSKIITKIINFIYYLSFYIYFFLLAYYFFNNGILIYELSNSDVVLNRIQFYFLLYCNTFEENVYF